MSSPSPMVRVGVDCGRRAVLERIRQLQAPVLVSANSLWNHRRHRFSLPYAMAGLDLALDSGGFVAMKRYGGYRWNVRQYVHLAGDLKPTWWAQMDFCCEPEIARDPGTVRKRISWTATHLQECQQVAAGENVAPPMPVLQGWKPEDYCRGPIYEKDYSWPDLVGIGSVCRRHVHGPEGVLAVVEALHARVPPHVRFHLFGVKSQAMEKLATEFPNRVASMDSMAWNMAARWDALHAERPCTEEVKAETLATWYRKQVGRLRRPTQQELLFN